MSQNEQGLGDASQRCYFEYFQTTSQHREQSQQLGQVGVGQHSATRRAFASDEQQGVRKTDIIMASN